MNEQLKIIISAEVAKLKQNLADAKSQVSSFKDKVKEASANTDANFKKIGGSIATGLKAGTAAIAAAGVALLALTASTEEYRQNQAKLATAFETAGSSAETAKKTYNELYRVLGDGGQATEAAAHLAKLTKNEKSLSQWTNICQGVYATFGDSLPIESLTEAANETAKTGTVTGALADALNWAGISEAEFNEKLKKCNTESEREKLIRNTLNKEYKNAASNYEKNNSKILAQRDAQAKLEATTAKLGEALAPVNTALTTLATDILATLTPHIQNFAEKYLPSLQEALKVVAEKLGEAISYLVDNWNTILAIAGIIGGITAAIGLYNTVAAIKVAMAAAEVTTVWGLVAAYAAQAAAMVVALAPYLLIVAAIAAVIAIIVLCVKNWDKIKAKVIEVWDSMKQKIVETAENIKQKISDFKDKVVAIFSKIINWVKKNWKSLLLLIANPFAGAFKLAYDNCEGFRNKVNAIFDKIKSGISNKVNDAKTAVTSTFEKMKTSVSEKANSVKTAVTDIFKKVKTAITKPVDSAKTAVGNTISKIKDLFNFEWSLPKLKVPKFTISPQGWKVGDLLEGSIPKLSVTWNAKGGVFDKPTLFNYGGSLQGIGEDGAEAVVPLEKNTKWLDKMATMLAQKQGKTPIILQVDGKTFAQISVDSINQLTKQTGNLPLKLV